MPPRSVGLAAAAAAGLPLDDSAADHSPPPVQSRRSTGSVTFDFSMDSELSEGLAQGTGALCDSAARVSRGRPVSACSDGLLACSSTVSSVTSCESEERFGLLCVSRSLEL